MIKKMLMREAAFLALAVFLAAFLPPPALAEQHALAKDKNVFYAGIGTGLFYPGNLCNDRGAWSPLPSNATLTSRSISCIGEGSAVQRLHVGLQVNEFWGTEVGISRSEEMSVQAFSQFTTPDAVFGERFNHLFIRLSQEYILTDFSLLGHYRVNDRFKVSARLGLANWSLSGDNGYRYDNIGRISYSYRRDAASGTSVLYGLSAKLTVAQGFVFDGVDLVLGTDWLSIGGDANIDMFMANARLAF